MQVTSRVRTPESTDAPATKRRGGELLWWTGIVVALAVIGIVMPVWWAHHYGALDIPRSDDWSYLLTLFHWDKTGHWDFNNWVSMTLIGQVFITEPIVWIFGHSIVAISIFWACVGLLGLIAVVAATRLLGLPRSAGALLALCIAACPLWGPLAPTFMTDVPAFAFQMFAVAFACAAFRRREWSAPLLTASLALAYVAVSIRQYAIVTLLAILGAAMWSALATHDRRRTRQVFVLAAVAGVAILVLLAWWSGVPHSLSLKPRAPDGGSVRLAIESAGGFFRLAGFVLLPIILLARPADIVRRAWRTDAALTKFLTIATGAGLVFSYVLDPSVPFVGNYFDRLGVLADDIIHGQRPEIMPRTLFNAFALLGSLASIVLVLAAVPFVHEMNARWQERRFPPPDPATVMLGASIVGFAAAYELAIVVQLPIFDRYALPVLPVVALAFLRSVRARAGVPAAASAPPRREVDGSHRTWIALSLLLLLFLGVVYTGESASNDGTRWKVAELLTQHGYPANIIDDGYEWIGWHDGRAPVRGVTIAERKKLRKQYLKGLCVAEILNPPKKRKPGQVILERQSFGLLRKPVWITAEHIPNSTCATPPHPHG